MTNNTGCPVCGGTGYVGVKSASFDYAQPCRNCGGLKTESHIPAVDRGGKMNIKEELLIVHSHTQQPVLKQAVDEIERLERESALRLEHMNYAKDGIISDQAQTIERLERELASRDQALQSLTPGGSEYVNDPKRCVAFVRSVRESQHETIIQATKRAKDAEAQAAAMREALEFYATPKNWMSTPMSVDGTCLAVTGHYSAGWNAALGPAPVERGDKARAALSTDAGRLCFRL